MATLQFKSRRNGGYFAARVPVALGDARQYAATQRVRAAQRGLVPCGAYVHTLRAAGLVELVAAVSYDPRHVYPRVYAPRWAVRIAQAPLPIATRRELLRAGAQGSVAPHLVLAGFGSSS
jgi:hypothetical protein